MSLVEDHDAIATGMSRAAHGTATLVAQTADDRERTHLAYLAVYACGFDGSSHLDAYRALASSPRDEQFLATLQEAITDTTVIELTDPRHPQSEGDRTVVELDGVRCYIPADAIIDQDSAGGLRVRAPVLLSSVMPGFVVRSGARPLVDRSALTRLYLDLVPEGAAWMLGTLARRLDAADAAYEMKALANPRAYLRHDAGVLYVPTGSEAAALATVEAALADAATPVIDAGSPALTWQVRPGIGIADDPTDLGGGLSHGQWVASLLMEAGRHSTDPAAIEAHITRQILAAGRDPHRPFRRGGGPTQAGDQTGSITPER